MSRESRLPPRPLVPLALPLLGVLVASIRTLVAAVPMESAPSLMVVGLVGASASSVAWHLLLSREGSGRSAAAMVVPCLLFLALGTCLSASLLVGLSRATENLASHPVSTFFLVVDADPTETDVGYRSRAIVSDEAGGRVGEVWLSCATYEPRGARLRCIGRFVASGDDEWGASSRAQGVAGTVKVSHVLSTTRPAGLLGAVMSLREVVVESFDPASSEGRALLAGIVCGERLELREDGVEQTFATCGLAHLVAVSGSHLAVLAAVLSTLLLGTRLSPGARCVPLIALLGLYVLFCGAPASAVRSWVMCVASTGSQLAGRRSHATSSVCLTAIAMCCLDPSVTGQLGFLLSVVSVVGLSLFSGYAGYLLGLLRPRLRPPRFLARAARVLPRSVGSSLSESVSATLVAQAVTMPLTVDAFGGISLVAPLANALVAPLFSLLVGLGMAAACTCRVPVASGVALLACDAVSGVMLRVARVLSGVPCAMLPVASAGLAGHVVAVGVGAGILLWWPEPTRRRLALVACAATAACVSALAAWRFLAPARVVVLDVGQGDAILVQDGGSSVLIDTGPGDSVADALARYHVLHLDAVVLTHLHDDHVGGLESLEGRVGIDEVLVARGVADDVPASLSETIEAQTHRPPGELSRGDAVEVGGFELRCVWPEKEVDGRENADSLCFSLAYASDGGSLSAYLTGDAEEDETRKVIASGGVGDVDFLKVGHHGSAVSIDSEEAATLDAEVAVASAGEGNRFGHPTSECTDVLERSGSRFLCTKDVGDVEVSPGREGPRVSCRRALDADPVG